MTTKLAELTGRPVLDIASATTVGQVDHAVLDAGSGSIAALRLAKVDGDADLLPWDSIKAIGPDAITIESVARLRQASSAAESKGTDQSLDPIGARLLTTAGLELGRVADVEVDEGSGAVETIATAEARHPGSSTVGFGTYALVVEAAPG